MPLVYSALKENLVQSIDLLTINSWGEWQVQRFKGENTIIDSLYYLLQYIPLARKQGWPEYLCHCFLCKSDHKRLAHGFMR